MGLTTKQIRDMEDMTDEELAALAGISAPASASAAPDLNTLSDAELEGIALGGAPKRPASLEKGLASSEPTTPLMEYNDATKGDVAGELLNAGRRGVRIAAEGAGDIYDIGRAAVDQFIPGAEDRSLYQAINPFADPDEGDVARDKMLWAPNREAVERKIKPGGSTALDFSTTALETAPSAFVFGGARGLGTRAVETATTSLGAGAGEQGTRAGAEALGVAPETAQEIGEVVGSILGGLSTPKADAKAKALVDKLRNRVSKPTGGQMTTEQATEALKKILSLADDQGAALTNISAALARGDKGTLGDMAQDVGVLNIEQIAPKGSVAAQNSARALGEREVQAVTDSQTTFGGALPDAPLNAEIVTANQSRLKQARAKVSEAEMATGQRINTQTGLAQANAAARTGLADEIAGELTPSSLASEQGQKTSDLFTTKQGEVTEVTKPLWDAFDNAPDIDTRQFDGLIEFEIDKLPLAQQPAVRSMLKDSINATDQFRDSMRPREVQALITKIKGQLGAKAADGSKKFDVTEAQVSGITKRIENIIETSPAGPAYQAAINATKQGYDSMGRGGLEKARRTASSPETLAGAIKLKGAAGAQTAREAIQTGDQRVIDRIKETLRSEAGRSGVTQKFSDDYADVLAVFDDVGTDVGMVLGLNNEAEAASAAAKLAERAQTTGLAQARSKAAGRSASINNTSNAAFVQDPMGTIKQVMNNDSTASRDMSALIRNVAKNPAQKAQLKQMVGENLMDMMTDPNMTGGGFSQGKAAFAKFEKVKNSLAEVMEPKELSALTEIMQSVVDTRVLRKASAKQPAVKLSQSATLAASGVAAGILKFMPGGTSLILANNVRTYIKAQMLTSPDPVIMNALNDMTGNPQAFRQAVDNFKASPGLTDKMLAKELSDFLISKAAAAGRKLQGGVMVPAVKSSGDEETIF